MNNKLGKAITITLLSTMLSASFIFAEGLSDTANDFIDSGTNIITTNTESEVTTPKNDVITQTNTLKNKPLETTTATTVVPVPQTIKTFSDVKPDAWYHGVVMNLVGRGGIGGYPNGTFAPNKGITNGEFLKIAYISATGDSGKVSGAGKHWASGVLESAVEKGIVKNSEITISDLNTPITRNEMARVLVRLAEYRGEGKVDTSKAASVMGDYSSIKPEYKYYVEQAYMKGLIAGMDAQGNFVGGKGGTRAEASAMIVRLLQENERVQVKAKEIPVGGRVIYLTDPKRPLTPKEGDIVVKADGTRVVLKKGSGGILGAGQAVDYYSGITFDNGYVFKEWDLGVFEFGGSNNFNSYAGQPYIIDKYGEGHFYDDWDDIANAEYDKANKIKNPKDGMAYGRWMIYMDDAGAWIWAGPDV